ncbi:MAG: MnhB domain-containing protein [Spirochaetota bacterium]|nr:MnhB domain-containing protein [Spirochaetota bacterium]
MVKRFDDIIIQKICSIMIPFMQIYSLYILVHGHGSPGGGFQGGCVLAASFILMIVAFDIQEIKSRLTSRRLLGFCGLGVLIYAGAGFVCILLGGNFLDYSVLSTILPGGPIMARYYGMAIIETGVQITVMAVMISIFLDLSTSGKHEEALED